MCLLNGFKEMRNLGTKNVNRKWYLEFCSAWDKHGVNEAQKVLRKYPKVFEHLKSISSNYIPGKSGNPFPRHELYALKEPNLSNKCSCGNYLPYNTSIGTWAVGCSRSCAAKNIQESKVRRYRAKHGVDNPSQNMEVQKKRTATIRERFGVDNAFQSNKVKRKIKKVIRTRYGVDNVSQSDEIQQRKVTTMRENFGTDHWTQSECMLHKLTPFNDKTLSKARKTCLEKYGVDNPFKSEEVQDLIKRNCLKKYGITNPGSIPNGFKRKYYTDRFGKSHVVQGYEPVALEYFDSKRSIIRIETGSRNVPRYRYTIDGSQYNYYPDLIVYTKSTSHIIEVKSTYTLRINLEVDIKKFAAATRSAMRKGQTFWLFYYLDNMELIRVKNPTCLRHLRVAGIDV